jgi:hypothetical protein
MDRIQLRTARLRASVLRGDFARVAVAFAAAAADAAIRSRMAAVRFEESFKFLL